MAACIDNIMYTLNVFGCSANADVQKNALALINAMFQRADLDRRRVNFSFVRRKFLLTVFLHNLECCVKLAPCSVNKYQNLLMTPI